MESKRRQVKILALLFLTVMSVQGGFVEPPEPDTSLVSRAESQTRLPCLYKVKEGETVVQVTWFKELSDGTKDQIITAHFEDGHTEFGRYSGRMRFENSTPTMNAALLIPDTEESDDGSYTCHISTFPNGNFEIHIALTVWILPISSLDPVVLVEGQSYGVVASCRAVGRPLPRLTWDTDLPGQHQDRTSEGGAVSSHYSLHPLRSMNGKKLDCLVSHPGLEQPRRISNRLEVQYPPDAKISPSPGQWYAGLEKAELSCEGDGQPKPQKISWTRKGGALPDGASAVGGRLIFGRGLHMNDSGVYECVVRNSVGVGKTEYKLSVAEHSSRIIDSPDNLLLIIIGASAGALVLVLVIVVLLVNRYHRSRTKRLERALSEKSDEIKTLSRHASFRRVNSTSTDFRLQGDDYALLRVDSRMKNSQMSLERPIYRGSQSTLVGKWMPPGEMEFDELGRPVVWHDGMTLRRSETDGEMEEHRRIVELCLKNSNMSLAQQDDGVGPRETDRRERDSPRGEGWTPPQTVAEGQEDEDDDSSSSQQISEALNAHFYYHDGVLRPRPHSNAILLHPRAQVI